MSKVKIQGNASGTGIFTVTVPATNTDRTITLPDTSSTLFSEAGGTIQAPVSINSNIDESSAYTAQLILNSNNKATGQYARLLFQHSDHGSASIASDYESSGYGNLIFSTRNGGNPSEKMRLDANGRLTTPYQPCFRVHINGGNAWSGMGAGTGGYFPPYDYVKFDMNSNYNNSTYRFTAPVTGNYYLEHCFSVNNFSNGTMEAKVFVNGAENLRSYGNMDTTTRGSSTLQFVRACGIVRMNSGDYAQAGLYNFAGTPTMLADQTIAISYFTGFLIG